MGRGSKRSGVTIAQVILSSLRKRKRGLPGTKQSAYKFRTLTEKHRMPLLFYSGFVLTMHDRGSVLHLNVGDRFLLFLLPEGEPPTVGWSVAIGGFNPTAVTRNTDDLPIPRAQGFFEAVHPGQVTMIVDGGALCPPLPPEQCGPRGIHVGEFDLVFIVD
jgi:hypothetical protein